RNAASQVVRLPPEILCAILRLLSGASRQGNTDLVHVTHVCRHLRAVAIADSSLWTQVYVCGLPSVDRVVTFIKRSKARLLDIYFDFRRRPMRNFAPLARTLLRSSSRLRSIVVDAQTTESIVNLFCLIKDASAPHLETIDLSATTTTPTHLDHFFQVSRNYAFEVFRMHTSTTPSQRASVIHSPTPNLRSIRLKCSFGDIAWDSAVYQKLTELSVRAPLPSKRRLLEILKLCPELEILNLDARIRGVETSQYWVSEISSQDRTWDVPLPKLTSIAIHHSGSNVGPDLLTHLILPSATSYTLTTGPSVHRALPADLSRLPALS
ncbi:uncharacterized protein BXZ73DRAFT_16972, partial [Epithele typhae]|uniref:uncharacterized protein n=1 Tax=Epithele typhae TaxID=378194 RepID=UPI0020088BF9